MSTNLPPAGWHPDPENPTGSMRWWDGNQWTANVQPLQAPPAANYPGYGNPPQAWGTSQNWGAGPTMPATQMSFARRNQMSLTALGVGVLYILIDLTAHFFLIGIVPIMMAVRATQRKEQLAPLAIVMAVVAVAMALIIR